MLYYNSSKQTFKQLPGATKGKVYYMKNNNLLLTNEITVDGLIEQLEVFSDFIEIPKFHVIEEFKKNGKLEYDLLGLTATKEADVVIFDDLEDVIAVGETNVLNMIMEESVENIFATADMRNWAAEIFFKDGSIKLQMAM